MNRKLEDIPSVLDPVVSLGVPSPGDLFCDLPVDELQRRLKYLLMTFAQNETAVTLAKCCGVEFVEEEGVLRGVASREAGRTFNLACYAEPELRTFFDALWIEVQQ